MSQISKCLLNKKRLLIFDFDGTLADTTPHHARAFMETLAPFGIVVDYSRLAGRKTADALLLSFSDAGRPAPDSDALEALVVEKQGRARSLIAKLISPLPGVDEFLRWAKPRYQMALVSSGSRITVEIALEKLGYVGWFSPILCADDVIHAKPDPDGFLRALEITGFAANEAIVFEDSEAGFEAAKAANIDFLDACKLDWLFLKSVTQ